MGISNFPFSYTRFLWEEILPVVAFTILWFPAYNQNFVSAYKIGSTSYDESRKLVVDGSGNTYITGYFSGTTDFDPGAGTQNLISAGDYDIFIAKYNSSGIYQWAFRIGNTGKDAGFGIVLDASDNIYVSGYFLGTTDFDPGAGTVNLTSFGIQDIYIAKYNSSGTIQWAKNIGGSGYDWSNYISIDGSDNISITGAFNGTVDFDPDAGTSILNSVGMDDIFLANFNSSGILQWAINIGSTSTDVGRAVSSDASGNVYITGDFQGTVDFDPGAGLANFTSGGAEDIFLAKFNSSGIYQWAITLGGASLDFGYGVAVDGSGNVGFTGAFQGTVDFDPGAGIANLTSVGSQDIFIAKYNSSGNYQWAFNCGSTLVDNGTGLVFDAFGNIYVTGYFAGTADFDPGAGTSNLTSAGIQDIYMAKYSNSGNYIWAFKVGGTGGDVARDINLDGIGNIYATGYFESTVDFDPNAGTANLTSAGLFDIFVSKYYEPIPGVLPYLSGFESCDQLFSYDGVQVPLNSTGAPRTGTNHGQINGACSGGSAGCYDGAIITPLLLLKPGCTYTVKVYAKNVIATGNLTISKAVTATNSSMKAATGNDIIMASTPVTSTAYTLYSATFSVSTEESKYIGFQMYFAGAGGKAGAQMQIDDIVITRNDCGHCSNGIQDAGETSIDCGGGCFSTGAVGGTISPASQTLACGSGNFSLSLCNQTGSVQWQFSQDAVSWFNISGENGSALRATVNNTTYFRAKITSDGCSTNIAYSNSATVTITGTINNSWLTTGTNAWGTATNWSAGAIPTSCHNVTIPSGGVQPVISAAGQCNNLIITPGATLTQTTGGAVYFDIYGDLKNEGTFNYSGSTSNTRLYGGLNFLGGTGLFTDGARYLVLQPASNYLLSSDLSVNNIDIQSGGSLMMGTYILTCITAFNQAGNFFANAGTLELQSGATIAVANTNWGTGTLFINVSGNNALNIVDDYYNIKIGNTLGNSTSLAANISAYNDFIIDNVNTTFNGSTYSLTIGGDFINNGSFNGSASTVVFNGSEPQNITGSSNTTFNNLTINNSSSTGITLGRQATINNILALSDGNIYSSSANLLLLNAAATVSPVGGSAASYIDGPVRKTGSTAFIFPTGDNGRWRRIGMTAPDLPPDAFDAEYHFSAYGTYTIDATECNANEVKEINSTEYWTFERTGGIATPQITLYWEDASASSINDCPDLQIATYDAVNTWWENNHFNSVSIAGSCVGSGIGSIQTNTGITEYGYFTLSSKSMGAPNSFNSGCAPANLYWVGGASGTWNVAANWSASTGGGGGAGIPDINTNVYFDNNSGASIVTVPAGTWYTKNFSMSGTGAKTSLIGQGVLLPRP